MLIYTKKELRRVPLLYHYLEVISTNCRSTKSNRSCSYRCQI